MMECDSVPTSKLLPAGSPNCDTIPRVGTTIATISDSIILPVCRDETPSSRPLPQKAKRSLPHGVTRAERFMKLHPIYVERGAGSMAHIAEDVTRTVIAFEVTIDMLAAEGAL